MVKMVEVRLETDDPKLIREVADAIWAAQKDQSVSGEAKEALKNLSSSLHAAASRKARPTP
jgi:hypothetical protein